MKIWIVTYGDGFEFSGLFIDAWTDQTKAELRCLELNEKYTGTYGGYDVMEVDLDTSSDD